MDLPDPTRAVVPPPSVDVAPPPPADPPPTAPRILRRAELDLRPDERLVWSRATGTLVIAMICFALAGLAAWRYAAGTLSLGWTVAGGFCGLFGVGLVLGWRSSLRPEAWLLSVGPERILISIRPYLSDKLTAGDPHILELPVSAIASVRQSTNRRMHQARGESGISYTYVAYLDFRTRGLDLEPLRQQLAREWKPRGTDGNEHVLVEDTMVRVRLGSTRPEAQEVAYMLGEYLVLEPDVSETGSRKPRRKHRAPDPPAG
ncbi:hypothetical protein [Longimicrobium sp.]|uniref:hypothetical protein n=1 Tax=Longimicrobium sp. TaxID=2029185 RepID=UPI002E353B24|nr:hypothetical protein [Longimicrobium sp.]HEX6038604.1 hypothetical protein [Longimicrobium sp.]